MTRKLFALTTLTGAILTTIHTPSIRHHQPAHETPSSRVAPRVASRSWWRHPRPAPTHPAQRGRGWRHYLSVTAYCATGSRTANGHWPHTGTIATLNRSIPFGTQILINGIPYTVDDRIGAGSDIDIYLGDQPNCEQAALTYGRHHELVRQLP